LFHFSKKLCVNLPAFIKGGLLTLFGQIGGGLPGLANPQESGNPAIFSLLETGLRADWRQNAKIIPRPLWQRGVGGFGENSSLLQYSPFGSCSDGLGFCHRFSLTANMGPSKIVSWKCWRLF
jgi:hypothetical protein